MKVISKSPSIIVQRMMKAAAIWNVGPMAAVAGAIADAVEDYIETSGVKK